MNPNAASFSFSAGASEWTPGGAAPPPPPPAAAAPVPEEKDKLWKCVLKLANGDRGEAKRLLQNPAELIAKEEAEKARDLKAEEERRQAPRICIETPENTLQTS